VAIISHTVSDAQHMATLNGALHHVLRDALDVV
jgi:hypothetical protein